MASRSVLKRVTQLGRVRPVAIEPTAIHEECRRNRDATPYARVDVPLNSTAHDLGCQIVGDCHRIHAHRCRVLDEIVVLQSILILVQKSMHRPKRILSAMPRNGFRCVRGRSRMWMLFSAGKISKHEPHVIADLF